MIALVRNVNIAELIGIVVVVGCLIAAGLTAFRGLWIHCLCLLGVAIVAAYLLL
jgi:hypothetical protein